MAGKKKKHVKIEPNYVKDSRGRTTHVYLPYNAYEKILKRLEEYERVKKREGVRWVQVSGKKCSKAKKTKR